MLYSVKQTTSLQTTRSNGSYETNVIDLLESKCRDHRIREQRMQEQLKIANRHVSKSYRNFAEYL